MSLLKPCVAIAKAAGAFVFLWFGFSLATMPLHAGRANPADRLDGVERVCMRGLAMAWS
jgi:threonine/homoserine/homoserine lactone efflux protein